VKYAQITLLFALALCSLSSHAQTPIPGWLASNYGYGSTQSNSGLGFINVIPGTNVDQGCKALVPGQAAILAQSDAVNAANGTPHCHPYGVEMQPTIYSGDSTTATCQLQDTGYALQNDGTCKALPWTQVLLSYVQVLICPSNMRIDPLPPAGGTDPSSQQYIARVPWSQASSYTCIANVPTSDEVNTVPDTNNSCACDK
jgi:hypothetical protein